MNNFECFSPDAIDLSLCATTVSESDHNQAEAGGISEQMRISIIHYHRQENDNDKFLNWYGEYFSFSTSDRPDDRPNTRILLF